MKPIPKYGDHMKLGKFIQACQTGGFINYDGYGYYATIKLMTGIVILPSQVKEGTIDRRWSHVVWFNR